MGGHKEPVTYCFLLRVAIKNTGLDAYLDTGATISLISSRFVNQNDLVPTNICGAKTGDGGITLIEGEVQGEVQVGDKRILQNFQVFNTDAFEVVLGTDFFETNKWIRYLSLQTPTHLLVVNEEDKWEAIQLKEAKSPRPTVKMLESVPLALDSECKYESIRAMLNLHRTENYIPDATAKRHAFRELGFDPNLGDGDFVELSASKENADMVYYCTPNENNTWWYDWGKLAKWKTLYANPPFSKIQHTLTKVWVDQEKLFLVVPEGKQRGKKKEKWGSLLEKLAATKNWLYALTRRSSLPP